MYIAKIDFLGTYYEAKGNTKSAALDKLTETYNIPYDEVECFATVEKVTKTYCLNCKKQVNGLTAYNPYCSKCDYLPLPHII